MSTPYFMNACIGHIRNIFKVFQVIFLPDNNKNINLFRLNKNNFRIFSPLSRYAHIEELAKKCIS